MSTDFTRASNTSISCLQARIEALEASQTHSLALRLTNDDLMMWDAISLAMSRTPQGMRTTPCTPETVLRHLMQSWLDSYEFNANEPE